MSSEEIVLIVLAGGLGIVSGGTVAGITLTARRRNTLVLSRRLRAAERWLDARLNASHDTINYVNAFRAVACEPRTSALFSQREHEARKAAARWRSSRRVLERVESTLVLWSEERIWKTGEPPLRVLFDQAVSLALHGGEDAVLEFIRRMQRADETAKLTARRIAFGQRPHTLLTQGIRAVLKRFSNISDQWSRL